MNELISSRCYLYLSKVSFNYDDNYVFEGGQNAVNYFISKAGFTFTSVQFGKFENEMKYVLRLDDQYNAQFNQLSISNSYLFDSSYNKLFNYAVFKPRSEYKKNADYEISEGYILYFVRGVKWKSPQTIELDLKMDVLNTLYISNEIGKTYQNKNHIFDYDEKSNITRYHKKRIEKYNNLFYPYIDKLSEGIQAPLYKKEDTIFNVGLRENYNYYLVYKNSMSDSSDTNNVVDCFLTYGELGTPLNENVFVEGEESRKFTPDVVGNNYIYLVGALNITFYDELTQQNMTLNLTAQDYACIFKVGNYLSIYIGRHNTQPGSPHLTSFISFNTDITYYISSSQLNNPSINDIEALSSATLTINDSLFPFYDINKLNRTDSKLIKIIKLPYVPTQDINYTASDYFEFNSSIWQYDSNTKMLKLIDLNTKFKSDIVDSNWSDVLFNYISGNSKSPTALRSIENEYKLYHSDFRYRKINYDSFNLIIYNELLKLSYKTTTTRIEFNCTTTINSRFIFKIVGDIYEVSYTDYPTTLTIARNNELGLYNSSYINYIRNGFNYDVKNKNRSVGVQYGLGAVQILGAVGSAISSAYTGGFGVAGAITLGTSAIATLTHAINSQISQETQIQQKLESLKAQANEVESSDDVDLLDVYNENRLHAMRYSISDEMKELLFNLFHYTGYKANVVDNITNYINTRYWFNYIQCDLHLINVSKQIPLDIIEEFKNKFRNGITIFHRHDNIIDASVDDGYNIKQNLENWDVEIVDET